MFSQDKSCPQKCYVPFWKWKKSTVFAAWWIKYLVKLAYCVCRGKHPICSQFLSYDTHAHIHTNKQTHTHTNTHPRTYAQTLKLGTISIMTQHCRFDYHWVRAAIAYCTIHLRGEAPFINISSVISFHTHARTHARHTLEYILNWSNKITITCFITECRESSYQTSTSAGTKQNTQTLLWNVSSGF